MIWDSEKSVKQREASLDPDMAKDLKNNKVAQGLDMMDKMMKLTENKAIKRVTSLWRYIVSPEK